MAGWLVFSHVGSEKGLKKCHSEWVISANHVSYSSLNVWMGKDEHIWQQNWNGTAIQLGASGATPDISYGRLLGSFIIQPGGVSNFKKVMSTNSKTKLGFPLNLAFGLLKQQGILDYLKPRVIDVFSAKQASRVVVQRPVQCNGVIASERPHWDGHIPMRLSSHYTNERNRRTTKNNNTYRMTTAVPINHWCHHNSILIVYADMLKCLY